MASVKDLAISVTSLSEVMQGKDKMSVEEIISKYPDGVTIVAFDIVENGQGEQYSVYNIAENSNIFCNGGTVLNKVFNKMIDAFGDIDNANAELTKEPLKVKLEKAKTKTGNNFTKVIVL